MLQRMAVLAALVLAANSPVAAQQADWPGVPEEQAAQIRAAGAVIDEASFAIFAPLVPPPPYDDVTVAADIAYGNDPAQKLSPRSMQKPRREGRLR